MNPGGVRIEPRRPKHLAECGRDPDLRKTTFIEMPTQRRHDGLLCQTDDKPQLASRPCAVQNGVDGRPGIVDLNAFTALGTAITAGRGINQSGARGGPSCTRFVQQQLSPYDAMFITQSFNA